MNISTNVYLEEYFLRSLSFLSFSPYILAYLYDALGISNYPINFTVSKFHYLHFHSLYYLYY